MVVSFAVRQMPGSFLLACAGGALFLGTMVSASTTSSSSASPTPSPSASASSSLCDIERENCYADRYCLDCLTGFGADYSSSTECQEVLYPVSTSASTCESLGSDLCCSLGNASTTDACMSDTLFISHWTCFMADVDCSVEDMPCYVGSEPTPQPSGGPVGRDIDAPSSSGSVTAGDDSLSTVVCADEAAICLEEDVCEGCYSDAEEAANPGDYTYCQLGYLELDDEESPSTAASSLPGVCALIGAEYCCRNDFSTADCLADGASVGYWMCVFEYYGCAIDELPCLNTSGGASYRTDDDVSVVSDTSSSGVAEDATEDAAATSDNGTVGWSTQSGRVPTLYAWTIFTAFVVATACSVIQ